MFDCLEVTFELVRVLRRLIEQVRRHDADLAKQLRKAGSSIALSAAEGRQRIGGDQLQLYRVALGSAAEVVSALRIAEAWGYVEPAGCAEALVLLDRVRAMLWRLSHPR